ncbi:MAG TPA: hypothetical protein VMV10_29490 [Pirellulales bacterium]|nr:hypothetical protein [Pirellulales bacterium]
MEKRLAAGTREFEPGKFNQRVFGAAFEFFELRKDFVLPRFQFGKRVDRGNIRGHAEKLIRRWREEAGSRRGRLSHRRPSVRDIISGSNSPSVAEKTAEKMGRMPRLRQDEGDAGASPRMILKKNLRRTPYAAPATDAMAAQ